MEMTKERRGEIAVLILKNQVRRDGIRMKEEGGRLQRELPNQAAAIGVPVDELKLFARHMLQDIFNEMPAWADKVLGPLPR